MVLIVLFPLIIPILMLDTNYKQLHHSAFKHKYAELYEDLNTSNKINLLYKLVFLVIRIIFGILAIVCQNIPGL